LTGYTLYALPDAASLGENAESPACGQTLATECILYVGNNQNDFSQPHLWSAPFFIATSANDAGTPAGDGSQPTAAPAPSAATSTVVASPKTAVADGLNQWTLTVTLLDANNVPESGKAVTLTPSCTPSPCATDITPSSAVSDASGQTTFTVTDSVAQSVTFVATDTTDSVKPTQTATVTFQAPVATQINVAANPTTVPASGSTTLTVVVADQASRPLPGQTVTLSATGSAVITPASTPSVTDAQGAATFTANDAVAEVVTFTPSDTTSNITNPSDVGTATVTFGTLIVSASTSTFSTRSPSEVTQLPFTNDNAFVTLRTAGGSPVAGKQVSLQVSGNATVSPFEGSGTTDANGQAQFSVSDSVAETVMVTATDTTDGLQLPAQPTIVFEPSMPSASQSKVLAGSTSSPADGATQTLITVTVNDQFGGPLSGKVVSLQAAPAGNAVIQPVKVGGAGTAGVTNDQGQAQFEVTDSHPETVTLTATDDTDNFVVEQTASIVYESSPPPVLPEASDALAFPLLACGAAGFFMIWQRQRRPASTRHQ
jgi:hypothetical protein